MASILTAKISVDNQSINVINPHYPINGRMCTLEDLFIEYNQLNLLNHSYRLLEPEKDLCPSVKDIYDDNVKVYYIEEDIYQEFLKEDASIYFYNYQKSADVSVFDVTQVGNSNIYTCNINGLPGSSTIVGQDGASTSDDKYRETIAEVYKQFSRVGKYEQFPSKYANYWAIYMRDDLFSSYIQNRMYEYFDQGVVTEDDSENILLNILATKIREQQKALGKDVFLKELKFNSTMWSNVGTILVEFFEDVFINLTYKNEFVFYSENTKATGIKALNIITEYWQKIDPSFKPDQSKCRYKFQISQDVNGYYIKTTSPIQVKKYLARKIVDIDVNGDKTEYIKYIHMDDIEDMALQLMHWIQKNFIYLPYHIPNIGVNTLGTQQIYEDNNGNFLSLITYEDWCKTHTRTEEERYTNRPYPNGVWTNYKKNETNSLVRMCDIQPGFIVFSDEANDYTENSSISTNKSNTAFLYNQTNTAYLNNYALSPENYITVNAEFDEKYYTYLCAVDIGDNDKDILKVTVPNNVKYVMQKTFYEKGGVSRPIYNIAFMPSKTNKTGNIITYNASILQTLSGITKTITFKQYPTQFIVFPELNRLSSKYYYEIERFIITSPVVKTRLLNVNNNKFTKKDIDNNEIVVYMHQLYILKEIDSKGRLKLREYSSSSEFDAGEYWVEKTNLNNIKRLNQSIGDIYYLMSYMTDTQDLTKEITMEITISVYDNNKYNQWKQEGIWTDDAGNEHIKLLPLEKYEVARDDSCNVIINFYEIENYVISKTEVNGKLVVDQQETDKQLVAQNKNSLHKYVGGRTDMEVDTQFNTMKFSNTSTVAKNVQVQFATGYTSWINGKKIRLKIIQHIDTDLEEQSTDNEGENNS